MNTKEFKVKYKDEGNGTLEGYASTWIRKADSAGDVVMRGAFKRSLETRWNGGKGIPLLWAHQTDNLSSYIGTANAEEDEKGLHFVAEFDGTDEAQRVRELYKDGRLRKFSFAYDTLNQAPVKLEDGTKANELRELDIHEISCCLVPANDDTGVVAVKSDKPEKKEIATVTVKVVPELDEEAMKEVMEKAGRRNSRKDADAIREAISLLQGVLGELEDNDAGEDGSKGNPAGEDPKKSNPEIEELIKKSTEILRRNNK